VQVMTDVTEVTTNTNVTPHGVRIYYKGTVQWTRFPDRMTTDEAQTTKPPILKCRRSAHAHRTMMTTQLDVSIMSM